MGDVIQSRYKVSTEYLARAKDGGGLMDHVHRYLREGFMSDLLRYVAEVNGPIVLGVPQIMEQQPRPTLDPLAPPLSVVTFKMVADVRPYRPGRD